MDAAALSYKISLRDMNIGNDLSELESEIQSSC